ncbi:hypothetical protein F3G14_18890, partial [Acinetobacter baumannii]
MQVSTDRILEQIPTAEIVVLGDFNAHHSDWLGSTRTDHAGRSAHDFAISNGLTQMVPSPTRVPDVEDHSPSLFDLLLTSRPEPIRVWVDAPLGSSDHCLVRSVVPLTVSSQPLPSGRRR